MSSLDEVLIQIPFCVVLFTTMLESLIEIFSTSAKLNSLTHPISLIPIIILPTLCSILTVSFPNKLIKITEHKIIKIGDRPRFIFYTNAIEKLFVWKQKN